MMTMRLLIIGGSDAGISAALRARECDPGCEVTVVLADRFPNYSICGLPFYLSGEVTDWHALAHQTAEDLAREGIHLLQDSTVQAIDAADHVVTVRNEAGETAQLPYDRLVIANGAVPVHPRIVGLDLPGVFLLRWMEDAFTHRRPGPVEPRRGRARCWVWNRRPHTGGGSSCRVKRAGGRHRCRP